MAQANARTTTVHLSRIAFMLRGPCCRTTSSGSPHDGEVLPEILKAIIAAEKRGEIGRVDQDDVSGSPVAGRHPKEAIELLVARGGEGVGKLEIDRLAREDLNLLAIRVCQFVVRKMRMKIERRNVVEQT